MNKSDTAQAPFSGSFLETQEDLWFSGVGKRGPREGLRLAKVTQQVGDKVRNKLQGSSLESPSLSKQPTGSLETLLWPGCQLPVAGLGVSRPQ